jgi:hypothetical protein
VTGDNPNFIVPKTFRKISVQNKLNKNFHLIYDRTIPPFIDFYVFSGRPGFYQRMILVLQVEGW